MKLPRANSAFRKPMNLLPGIQSASSEKFPRLNSKRPANSANRASSWATRNALFFKPSSGFGGKAAYRGDKITKKVWAQMAEGDYVAQDLVQPSARKVSVDGVLQNLKADLRAFTYDGHVRLLAARLYQGQTTNFRTPGGGFAPVFVGKGSATCGCR